MIIRLSLIIGSLRLLTACFFPPAEALYLHDSLIDNTATILLVECYAVDTIQPKKKKNYSAPPFYTYHLKVVETLKGESNETLIVNGRPRIHSSNTYNNHSDSLFWNTNVGRTRVIGGECGPEHCFAVGNQYLYFVETRINSKAGEMIENKDDLWLKYVRERLATE